MSLNAANTVARDALAIAQTDPLKALVMLETALASGEHSAKGNAMLARNAGVVATGIGEHARALKHYKAASNSQPDEPGTHLARANALVELGKPQEARLAMLEGLAVASRIRNREYEELAQLALKRLG